VGTLAQLYKAPDVLIKAVGICLKNGLDVYLSIVGDGKHRGELENLAESLGLKERIAFLGQLKSGKPVRDELDKADLFILPSKGEGLPRAMIEAMARGLPCIGSSASGIPELLPAEDMVAAGNIAALAGKIQEVISSPARMAAMSERNLKKSRDYLNDLLQERRIGFFRELRQQTETFHQR
jgi:glycosyltransferase involved in cell wall biosynthesis